MSARDRTAYLKRYPRGRRRPPAVGSHDQPGRGRRRSRGPDRPSARTRRWWRAMSARCGGSWWPHQDYLKARGEPKHAGRKSPRIDTIQFGAMTAALDWRFVEDGREIRVASTPRFATNSSDAAIQYAEADGGLTRVMAYQAAESLKAGRLKIVLARIRAAGDADPHRLSDVAAAVGQGAHLHRSRDRDRPTGISAKPRTPAPSSAPRETSRWPARSRRRRP